MQPYQEEYIANIREITALADQIRPGKLSFAAYELRLRQSSGLVREKVQRNM